MKIEVNKIKTSDKLPSSNIHIVAWDSRYYKWRTMMGYKLLREKDRYPVWFPEYEIPAMKPGVDY